MRRALSRIAAGLVIACVGDSGAAHLQAEPPRRRARRPRRRPCRSARRADESLDFVPWGWDERQFNSPGFDLPVGCSDALAQGEFPEYHSSADDLEPRRPHSSRRRSRRHSTSSTSSSATARYVNLSPKGEPQLGKRGLYPSVGGADAEADQLALLWVLNLSDGRALAARHRRALRAPLRADPRRGRTAPRRAGLLDAAT